jgi:glutamine synthetase
VPEIEPATGEGKVFTAPLYTNELIENVKGQKSLGIEDDYLQPSIDLIKRISKHIAKTKESVSEMNQARKEANQLSDARDMAIAYCEKVIPSFETIRYHIDKLEMLTDDSAWPLPKYRELLFIR